MRGNKDIEQQCSTQLHDSKGYSSRYQKIKTNKASKPLPFQMQKATIIIQRYWRFHRSMRRKFYEAYINELVCVNSLMHLQINNEKQRLKISNKQLQRLKQERQDLVAEKIYRDMQLLKKFQKQCIISAFKIDKKLNQIENCLNESNRQDDSLEISKTARNPITSIIIMNKKLQSQIWQLKQQKQRFHRKIQAQQLQDQQLFLKEIRQANAQLLRIVTQKNQLQHRIKQKQIKRKKKDLPC